MEKASAKNRVEGLEEIDYNSCIGEDKTVQKKTYISNALELAANKAKYNAQVKKILSDKTILAWILKYTTKEFQDYPIDVIRDSIEGTPEVSSIPIYPGKHRAEASETLEVLKLSEVSKRPEAITGLCTSDQIPNEGEVTYDIRFYTITPTREQVKLIINVEAQKKYYVGYDLVTRGVFYCARMLSSQLDTEFSDSKYDQIKKVYSIWICMDVPEYLANTMTEYKMEQHNLYGNAKNKSRYDLLSVVMVCLGKEKSFDKVETEGTKLHRLLFTLLSETLSLEEKEETLNKEYGIATERELKEGMGEMCNLADLIEERGIERGIEQGIERGIEQGIERGIEQGIERGIERGIEQGKRSIVINMLKRSVPDNEICALTECSQEFVDEVRRGIVEARV